MKGTTIAAIIEDIFDDFCDTRCKYPVIWDDEAMGCQLSDSDVCRKCPMNRLYVAEMGGPEKVPGEVRDVPEPIEDPLDIEFDASEEYGTDPSVSYADQCVRPQPVPEEDRPQERPEGPEGVGDKKLRAATINKDFDDAINELIDEMHRERVIHTRDGRTIDLNEVQEWLAKGVKQIDIARKLKITEKNLNNAIHRARLNTKQTIKLDGGFRYTFCERCGKMIYVSADWAYKAPRGKAKTNMAYYCTWSCLRTEHPSDDESDRPSQWR